MAEIVCSFQEFIDFIGPRIRNNIANMTRPFKRNLGSKCQKCGEKKKELDAAHKHGNSRREIIARVLNNYETTNDGVYKIDDIARVLAEINNAHIPIEDCFLFLCRPCHREYESETKYSDSSEIQEDAVSANYKPRKIENQRVQIKDRDRLCKKIKQSWKYKIGWTSPKNRKNIEELISKIEENFDCHTVASKSWHYHNRNDNGRQFSGIICHKDRSLICFRVEPFSFTTKDSRIIHGKRWFFPEGKEKRIDIVPENYNLIIDCLSHAYKASGH